MHSKLSLDDFVKILGSQSAVPDKSSGIPKEEAGSTELKQTVLDMYTIL
jgi:hypothetical protein